MARVSNLRLSAPPQNRRGLNVCTDAFTTLYVILGLDPRICHHSSKFFVSEKMPLLLQILGDKFEDDVGLGLL